MSKLRQNLLRSSYAVPVAAPCSTASNAVSSQAARPEPTIDEMMAALDRAMIEIGPKIHGLCIGAWYGHDIYVDPAVPPGEIVCVDPATNKVQIRVKVDHPLMRGTKMGNAAREALGLSPLPAASPRLP